MELIALTKEEVTNVLANTDGRESTAQKRMSTVCQPHQEICVVMAFAFRLTMRRALLAFVIRVGKLDHLVLHALRMWTNVAATNQFAPWTQLLAA